jgi:predicted XRE-type DNA-binding protein
MLRNMGRIVLREKGRKFAAIARRLGVTQPRQSNLLRGKIQNFSLALGAVA